MSGAHPCLSLYPRTVQIVTYLEHLFRVEKLNGPFLVVVPLSTVEHWRREFEGWTNLQCCVYHDRQRVWRDVLREYEWYYEDRPHTPDYLKFNVLGTNALCVIVGFCRLYFAFLYQLISSTMYSSVTTYDTLIGDFDVIGDVPWRVTVVDEAHRLRNVKGKLLECMKEISAKGTLKYGYQSRVLMTGTPLQNNTQGEHVQLPCQALIVCGVFLTVSPLSVCRTMDTAKLH